MVSSDSGQGERKRLIIEQDTTVEELREAQEHLRTTHARLTDEVDDKLASMNRIANEVITLETRIEEMV